MVTVCHPMDDLEQLFLMAALEAADIPCFLVGQHFGSLYPGVQIPWCNERSIRVPSALFDSARDVVEEVRAAYVAPGENLTIHSKVRMLCEVLVFGWVLPGGDKQATHIPEEHS